MKIALLGDLALIGKYDLTQNDKCFERLKSIRDFLAQFDFVIGNLESPLTDVKKTWVPKSMHLRSPSKNVEILKYLGVDAVSIANNHMYDFGRRGFQETIRTLEGNEIDWFGACGKNIRLQKDSEFIIVSGFCCASTNGVHLGSNETSKKFIHLLNKENIAKQIQSDEADNAFSLIVSHWGQEHTSYPGIGTINVAHKIAKMKSNLAIVAHHPHQIQGIEKHNNNLIAYSLGNFLFDDCVSINGKMKLMQTEANKKTFIIILNIEHNQLIDYQIQGFVDDDDAGMIKYNIESELNEISAKITDFNKPEYETLRRQQIASAQQKKFGKHDFKWFISRFNYYAIGAKLMAYISKIERTKHFL